MICLWKLRSSMTVDNYDDKWQFTVQITNDRWHVKQWSSNHVTIDYWGYVTVARFLRKMTGQLIEKPRDGWHWYHISQIKWQVSNKVTDTMSHYKRKVKKCLTSLKYKLNLDKSQKNKCNFISISPQRLKIKQCHKLISLVKFSFSSPIIFKGTYQKFHPFNR